MPTVTVLGSGSVEFGRSLVADLLGSAALGDLRLVLHDTDAGRLGTSVRLARAAAETMGSGATVVAAAGLGEAPDGADYVVNQVNVGGFAATRLDFEVRPSTSSSSPRRGTACRRRPARRSRWQVPCSCTSPESAVAGPGSWAG